jgi:hypothetical protein
MSSCTVVWQYTKGSDMSISSINSKPGDFFSVLWPPLKPDIMKILFLRLFSRMSCFLIERDFKSCKEISLKFSWNLLSKRSILVKKPAGSKKFSIFKCNFLSWASLGQAGFFPVKVHDQGFQTWYVTLALWPFVACESGLKTP